MKLLIFAFLLQVGLATASSAAPISVRSGEHESFSRLVMQLPSPMTWQLIRADNGYVLELSDRTATFDIEGVFRRIPNTRIQNIVPVGNRLNIEFECDCEVKGFLESNRLLWIDVSDPNSQEIETEAELDFEVVAVDVVQENAPEFEYGELLWKQQTPQITMTMPSEAEPVYEPRTTPRIEATFQDQNAAITSTEKRLLEAIGQAATQGLLNPAQQEGPVDEVTSNTSAQLPEVQSERAMDRESGSPELKRQNIKVTGSLDVETPRLLGDVELTQDGIVCPEHDVANVGSWGTDEPFGLQIGRLRSELVGEFDRENSDAITALARAYLYFGFGAEAKQVIRLNPVPRQQDHVLINIADVLESPQFASGNIISQYSKCDGPIALWAILSIGELTPAAMVNANAALVALNELPPHLREYIGPILSTRFQQQGDRSSATAAIRIIDRIPAENPAATELAKAQISIDDGDATEAQESLTTVINENTELSPMALVELVDLSLERGFPISSETALLVDAYERQHRNDPVNAELKRIQVLSLAISQQFSAAFEAISKIENHATRKELKLSVLPLLTKNAGDIEFLKHALRLAESNHKVDSVEVLDDLTRRMAENGFYAEAALLLDQADPIASNRNRRLFRAELALELEQPRRAEAELIGLSGADVDGLMAKAREQLGDFEASIALFQSANADRSADRAALFSNNWDALESSQQPELNQLARLIKAENPVKEEGSAETLAAGRELLRNSSTTRATIRSLLEGDFDTELN